MIPIASKNPKMKVSSKFFNTSICEGRTVSQVTVVINLPKLAENFLK